MRAAGDPPRFETELARSIARDSRAGLARRGPYGPGHGIIATLFILVLVASFALPTMIGQASATDSSSSSTGTETAPPPMGDLGGSAVPTTLPGSETTFSFGSTAPEAMTLTTGTGVTGTASSLVVPAGNTGGGSGGNRLGNAPESHYKNLQKFLAKGKTPPANYPVPYVIYTKSAGVELWTDAFTKQPVSIDVDNNANTGQGHKDVRVKTEITVNPLIMTTSVTLLGSPNPSDLTISVTFPAFFYTGETSDPDGVPYWEYGYQTQPSLPIPGDITMNFTVDHSVGATHTFKFAWTSTGGIPHLGFEYGVFQVVDQNTASPINPAFASFVVTSPSLASLTFSTSETATSSSKCMSWSAISAFGLTFGYDELRSILGIDFPMTVTVQDVPSAFSLCTTEDRAAHTYAVDYTASANVAYADVMTQIFPSATASVTIDLTIRDMPSSIHALLGDGSLGVTVSSPVGMVALNATANLGLADITSAINFRMIIFSLPSFTATWGQSSTGNFANLDTVSGCIGRIELAFSYADIVLPLEHTSDPTSHYLLAYSDASKTSIALRLVGVSHIGFAQNNNVGSNTLTLGMCGNNVLYILSHTTHDGMLTPGTDMDLRVVMTDAPTALSLTWTVPYVASITTNQLIGLITADLTYTTSPSTDLTAHAEIHNLPATTVGWNIAASGSISFTAGSPIGEVLLTATDPNGLAGATTAFGGQPIRLLNLDAFSVPSFTASWSSSSAAPPVTAVSFTTAPSTALGQLEFVISTDLTKFVTLSRSEENRGMFYSDDEAATLGAMVSSVWMHVQDVGRAAFSWGGSPTTITAGFGTSVSHPLSVATRLDTASPLNPAAPKDVSALLVTSPLPTSMDLSVTPSASFTYTATASIGSVHLDAKLGDLSAGAPTPANVDHVQLTVLGIPSTASGQWSVTGGAGFLHLQVGATLTQAQLFLDNAFGVFGSSFKHAEATISSLPQNANADWDTGARTSAISFTNALFSGGLGEARILATTMDDPSTTAYMNSLALDPSVCMTTYSDYEAAIDGRYWPGSVLAGDLHNVYCHNPSLDTGANDYVVYRTGGGNTVFAGRIRQLNSVSVHLGNTNGFGEVKFTPGVTTDRALYVRVEDTGANSLDLVRVDQLPNTAGTNHIRADYSISGASGLFTFVSSTVIDFIDLYFGTTTPTSQSDAWTKLLVVDLPSSASLSFNFGSTSGTADFTVSNTFQVGLVRQDSGRRYAGWIQLTGLHFEYLLEGPGSEPSSHDIGYFIAHVKVDLHTVPSDTSVNGILGIYDLKSGPAALTTSSPPVPANAYIPEWTFMLVDFKQFLFDLKWDIGVDFFSDSKLLSLTLFPSITLVTDFTIVIDYWWNSGFKIDLPFILLPLPPTPSPCLGAPLPWFLNGHIDLNPVPDYTENHQIHLLPFVHGFKIDTDMSGDVSFDCLSPPSWQVSVNLSLSVDGFHGAGDHGDPSPL